MDTFSSTSIPYKQTIAPKQGWVSYTLTIIMLLVMVLILAKKFKPKHASSTSCRLVEKKQLGHKTVVYVIEYQHHRFLLADNQHALALHVLPHEAPDA